MSPENQEDKRDLCLKEGVRNLKIYNNVPVLRDVNQRV